MTLRRPPTRRGPLTLRRRAALLAVSLTLVTFGAGGPAGAEDARVADAGWWWRAQTSVGVGLLAPPTVQPGQLLVQGAPDGPAALAAVRYTLPAGSQGATLALRVAEGGQPGPGAVVLACPPTGPWFGEDAGAWESRPEADCASSVPGMPSDDGQTWSFELDLLRTEDALDVILVPGSVEGLDVVGSTFSITFERPDAGDLTVGSSGGELEAPDLEDIAPVAPASDPGGPASAPDAGGFDLSPGGFSSPAPASPPIPDAPSLDGSGAAGAGTPPGAGRPGGSAGLTAEQPIVSAAPTGARGLGFALLAATVGATLWSLARPGAVAGMPGGLAGLALAGRAPTAADPVPGGLGRFARPRTGPPPGLR
jgi:hypothetical protein